MNFSDEKINNLNVINQLVNLIRRMPHAEQISLLRELEDRFTKFKRKHFRKMVRTSVEYSTNDVSDKGFINNISTGGVFIETRMPFRNSEPISLNFFLPNNPEKQIKIIGRIARITPQGVGVEFISIDEDLEHLISLQLVNM